MKQYLLPFKHITSNQQAPATPSSVKIIQLFLLTSVLLLVGCTSPGRSLTSWQEQYKPGSTGDVLPYSGHTVCNRFSDYGFERDLLNNISDGYESIGHSLVASWRNDLSTGHSLENLKQFGESIGADRISYGLVSKEFKPGSGVLRMWAASFYRKSKPDFGIQARFRDLTESESRSVGTRGGAYVLVVVKNGPAYLSNIFEGDIATHINGTKIEDAADFRSKCISIGAGEFTLTILRDGVYHKKVVRLATR